MARGPLDHPRLREVEQRLDAGRLDEAQRQLAEIGDLALFRPGIAYLATRILFERRRLDAAGVIERMRDVLRQVPDFAEAQALLARAERHQPKAAATPGRGKTAPLTEPATESEAPRATADPPSDLTVPEIPRAPLVPSFTPSPDARPSYAPAHVRPAGDRRDDAAPATAREPLASRQSISDSEDVTAEQPAQAGRYARHPTAAVEVIRSRPSSRPAPPSAPSTRRERPRMRSGRPPSDDEDPPSLVGITTALDAGRFDRAIELIERSGGERGSVLHARSLLAAGRRYEAREVLAQLAAGTLEPDARAAVARALIEVGEPERALREAEQAYRQDASSALVQLTVAWASLRVGRRRDDAARIARAGEILRAFKGRQNPVPALVQALRACVESHTGDPERAIGAAQRALALDARSTDALVALALASARLGRHDEARAIWQGLAELDAREADAIAPSLARFGVDVREQGPARGP